MGCDIRFLAPADWGKPRGFGQNLSVTDASGSSTDTPAGSGRNVSGAVSIALVTATSGLVLVLEIVAGRLLAPYIGVSLDTFTGIIGTILAGIAAGAAVGGSLADKQDPVRLIARALFFGGALTWLSIPIATALGPNLGSGPAAIITLTAAAFFLPAAVLSGIGPMVTKLELGSLDDTGSVVGKLSAASTFGALVGTFATGFILVTILPVRTIIFGVGALLVLAGIVLFVYAKQSRPDMPEILAVVVAALAGLFIPSPCDHTTDYSCVRIVADDLINDPDAREGGRSLWIDRLRHAHVDLDDPLFLDIRYMRLFGDAVEATPEGEPLRVLHVGGGGFVLPRFINEVRPGSENVVLELDEDLVRIAEESLGLSSDDNLDIRTGDARLHFADLESGSFDLIVGDAYGGSSVPWHLTTTEVMAEFDRLLDDDGLYIMNVIDGDESRFARSQLATVSEHFDELAVIEPQDGIPSFAVNQILLASHVPLPELDIDPADGRLFDGDAIDTYIGEDVIILTDDFAPADQLLP